MIDDWFRAVELKITFDEFERLPRIVGYKHEYFDDRCVLTPRQRNCYAALNLERYRPLEPRSDNHEKINVRPLAESDREHVADLCGPAFSRIPPFSSLTDEEQNAAGRDCMEFVRKGGDGPLLPEASQVAVDEHCNISGALLIVLKPPGYRIDPWRNDGWREPIDASAAQGKDGQPHIDWVFTHPWLLNRGIASAMLEQCVQVLRARGNKSLTSTYLLGNGESMAWHWRNGFELLPNPGSMRSLRSAMKDEMHRPHADAAH